MRGEHIGKDGRVRHHLLIFLPGKLCCDVILLHDLLVGVNIEKIDKVELAVLNIKSYLESAVPSIEQSLGNMGFVNITHSIGSVKLGDTDMTCLNVVSSLGEFKMYQTIVAIKCNGYLACITFSGDSTESIDSALSNFYWLE